MKRLHMHIHVENLDKAKQFYSALFGSAPTVDKPDYAKWSLEDPQVNLAISARCGEKSGVNHLGIQTDTDDELRQLQTRLELARQQTLDDRGANCCYAQSDKHWARDPEGLVWELFHTTGYTREYGEDHAPAA